MPSSSSRSILITSASGKIGSSLLPQLLSNPAYSSFKLILPTSNAAKLRAKLPPTASDNVIIAEGDVANATWLESLLKTHHVDTIFSNFAGIEELIYTLNLWDAAECAGVKHVVFLSACGDMSVQAVQQQGSIRNVRAAHVAHKFFLEQSLSSGGWGFSWTVIGPSLFFSNDFRSKGHILQEGLFNEPLGSKGVSRTSERDVGLAVAKALADGGETTSGRKIYVGSKRAYTGDEIARLWGEALGREVRAAHYGPEAKAQLEEGLGKHVGAAFGRDLALMYRMMDREVFGMTDEQYAAQVEFLGKEPDAYEEFVRGTAEAWLAEK